MGQPLDIFALTTNREISPAFADAARKRADTMLISPDVRQPFGAIGDAGRAPCDAGHLRTS
jgi:hypothetical protein